MAWADLSSTGDPADVPGIVAAAAGALPAGEPGAVARQLAGRRMLVCLDNCEHVLAGAADLALALLTACPDVTVLATGREPLGVPGEQVRRVPPLTADDAVALFDERSGGAPGSEHARDATRTACVRLDGIPLAIELAAAWSGMFSAEEILHGLDDRFALLVRGPRGVAGRRGAPPHPRRVHGVEPRPAGRAGPAAVPAARRLPRRLHADHRGGRAASTAWAPDRSGTAYAASSTPR